MQEYLREDQLATFLSNCNLNIRAKNRDLFDILFFIAAMCIYLRTEILAWQFVLKDSRCLQPWERFAQDSNSVIPLPAKGVGGSKFNEEKIHPHPYMVSVWLSVCSEIWPRLSQDWGNRMVWYFLGDIFVKKCCLEILISDNFLT